MNAARQTPGDAAGGRHPAGSWSLRRTAWIALAGAALLWTVFSWPLPRHMTEGIPSSSQNIEQGAVRRMIPGDHLQLLYHFWLLSDMAAGRTPWFNNLYEFNTGDDAAGRRVRPYYLPFSGVYALFSAAGGRALAWNLTGVVSLWLTWLFAWRLVRRYAPDEWSAAVFSLVAVTLPFRWVTLFGGSPSGFAMTWVPAVWLGIDRAVRDGRWTGGLLAGLALMFAAWMDKHTVFFAALAAPAWVAFALLHREGFRWRSPVAWRAPVLALLPAAVGAVPAVVQTWLRGRHLEAHAHELVRSVGQIGVFAPDAGGFFRWAAEGTSSHAYVGYTLALLIPVGLAGLVLGWGSGRHAARRGLLTAVLLVAAAIGVGLLALGPRGPAAGLAYRAACKLVPPYRMVRQPGKVFVLMPVLLAMAAGVAAGGLRGWTGGPGSRRVFVAAFGAVLLLEMKAQVRATVCLVDTEQAAYRAAAEEARGRGAVPRALVVPLWPGDSDLASSYEHAASLYRLRMVNGYSPVVAKTYVTNVYERLRAVNQGRIGAAELDALRGMGVTSVILHEDLFPEKVSPFPVGVTLRRFLANPHLRLLEQAGRVWAFALDAAPGGSVGDEPSETGFLPAARWIEIERASGRGAKAADEASCSGDAFARLAAGGSAVLPRARSAVAPEARWQVRVRGTGRLAATYLDDDKPVGPPSMIEVRADEWTWLTVDAPPPGQGPAPALRLACGEGTIEADVAIFTTPDWGAPEHGATVRLPPAAFFRAGYTHAGSGAVVFERERDPSGRVWYGPHLRLPAGRYRAELRFAASGAAAGLRLGTWRAEVQPAVEAAVTAGAESVAVEFAQPADIPFALSFDFLRAADIELRDVVLTRLD